MREAGCGGIDGYVWLRIPKDEQIRNIVQRKGVVIKNKIIASSKEMIEKESSGGGNDWKAQVQSLGSERDANNVRPGRPHCNASDNSTPKKQSSPCFYWLYAVNQPIWQIKTRLSFLFF